jgi:hypothetical protein
MTRLRSSKEKKSYDDELSLQLFCSGKFFSFSLWEKAGMRA